MTDKQIITEIDALNDIFQWLNDRPLWQRDAMRRLVSNGGKLSTEDLDELTLLCKNSDLPTNHFYQLTSQLKPLTLRLLH